MTKRVSVKSNFIYQVLYNVVTMVIPLVVTPFLTRALLENEIGRFTYTRSVASYFVIFAMMGIAKYGQRVISQNIDDEIKLRKSFWSLFFVHVIFSIIALVTYLFVVSIFIYESKKLFLIQGIYVGSALFDITWLYYGLEDFKGVVIPNAVIKVIEAILYLIFIKNPDDVLLYAFINCIIVLLSQLVLLPKAIKEIKPIAFSWKHCQVHIKPLIVLAVAVVGISLYTVFDTTLLGLFSTNDNVAFYEYSNRIAKIPLTVASIIGTVLFPRACKLAAQNNTIEQKKYMNYSMIIISIIGAVSFWGLLTVGEPLAELYLGENFRNCGSIIAALSPLVYIIGVGDVVRTQYMIPNGMDKEYIISITFNAITNLLLSTVLILVLPQNLQVYGAVIGTVAAEGVGMIYQLILCKKIISLKDLLKTVSSTFFIGAIMYTILHIFTQNIEWGVIELVETIAMGAMIFIPLTIIYIWFLEKDFRRIIFRK